MRATIINLLALLLVCSAHADQPHKVKAKTHKILVASWYSVESLKRDGQWEITKGVMANGKKFDENAYTCATRLYPLRSRLRITNITTGHRCIVKVTDRIGRRFAEKRIDLTPAVMQTLGGKQNFKKGLIKVKVELLARAE
ncbi:MAG: septal ring lytic transglycosylase RlpA family protein [Candidatus Omnitrophica bacterium]|nr:septal ring lytic transglycosylase RlpA family protein [Candidatus Omnitrophota bacterium]